MEAKESRIFPLDIEQEMRTAYIDYSMSVIVGRALPDVRDGLKPVHRRVLFAMNESGSTANAAYKKSSRIVGEVMGKYHPHGDSAIYDTMVRLAQEFSMRYMLVDGQGNFGSVDGDSPAAMRYTEARLSRLSEEMLRDIDADTVDWQDNYDGTIQEPIVLPSAFPNLLVNGSDGIAVGMATKIPPHNLAEVIDGLMAYIDDREVTLDQLMDIIPGPDFPTGGIIYGQAGIRQAYATGRGRVVMRARMHVEEISAQREALVITEIPYQVNKANLILKIAELVQAKRIEGISFLRDESDRRGMRIVVELERNTLPRVVESQLYKYTACQQTFGVNIVALANGRPQTLSLIDLLRHYLDHRLEVVTRRTTYELRKARRRGHILQGLTRALDELDAVISIIRHSDDTDAARINLMQGRYPEHLSASDLQRLGLPSEPPISRYSGASATRSLIEDALEDEDTGDVGPWLSEKQAQAILDLRLNRLTGLERDKIEEEFQAILSDIERLIEILGREDLRFQIIKDELAIVRDKYGDVRRTEIDLAGGDDIMIEDLIDDDAMVVSISHEGITKRTELSEYRSQGRGGVGIRAGGMRDDDFLEHIFVSNNLDYLLVFTDSGKCYWLRVFQIPEGGRTSKGRSIRNLIQIAEEDRIRAVLPVSKADFRNMEFLEGHFVVMSTIRGQVKKTTLEAFSRPRADGIIAINIDDGDVLLSAAITSGSSEIMLASSEGQCIRFTEDDVRPMGRNTRGVRGISLAADAQVIGMLVFQQDQLADYTILSVSENGYGKRTATDEFRTQSRGGKGILAMKCTSKTGALVAMKAVSEESELMLVTRSGNLIRIPAGGISVIGRNTQGVRLIRLRDADSISDVSYIAGEE